jgi:hypothetical protein
MPGVEAVPAGSAVYLLKDPHYNWNNAQASTLL